MKMADRDALPRDPGMCISKHLFLLPTKPVPAPWADIARVNVC